MHPCTAVNIAIAAGASVLAAAASTVLGAGEFTLLLGTESVIELLSHPGDRASRIVSALVVGDSDDDPQTQREEDLRPCMDAASGADVPEAAVFDRFVCSFDSTPAVVRLV